MRFDDNLYFHPHPQKRYNIPNLLIHLYLLLYMSKKNIPSRLSKYVHNEDFPYNFKKLRSKKLSKNMRKILLDEILNIPFLDILLINEIFTTWIQKTRKKYNIKPIKPNHWIDYKDYKKGYPEAIKETHQLLGKHFPKINDFGRIPVVTYLFEGEISPMGIAEVLSREPIITATKEKDPITGATYVNITYAIEEHTAKKLSAIPKEYRENIFHQLELTEDYFKKYRKPRYQLAGNRYLFYILRKKMKLEPRYIYNWFLYNQLGYLPPEDDSEEHTSEVIFYLKNTFSKPKTK